MYNYQQLDLKKPQKTPNNQTSKQPEKEQNHRYENHLKDYQLGEGNGEKGAGIKKHIW